MLFLLFCALYYVHSIICILLFECYYMHCILCIVLYALNFSLRANCDREEEQNSTLVGSDKEIGWPTPILRHLQANQEPGMQPYFDPYL